MPSCSSPVLSGVPDHQPKRLAGRLPVRHGVQQSGGIADWLRWGILLGLVTGIYSYDLFRVPGIEKTAGLLGLALSVLRGVLQYYSQYAVWILLPFYLLLGKSARFRWSTLWPVLMLLLFMGFMALVSDARLAVQYRGTRFLTVVLPAMLCMVPCTDRQGIRLVKIWIVGAAGVSIAFLLAAGRLLPLLHGDLDTPTMVGPVLSENYQPDRFVLLSDPITTAMIFYLPALVGFSLLQDLRQRWIKAGVLLVCLISIGLATITGARGPMVAFIVALVVMVAFARGKLWRKLLLGGAGIVVLGCFLTVLPEISPTSAMRVNGLLGRVIPAFDVDGTNSASLDTETRQDYYQQAMSAPVSLFGRGFGAFGKDFSDPSDYAHNLFLEAFYETGLAGLLVISFTFLYSLMRLAWYSARPGSFASFCLCGLMFYFVECQFSGSLIMEPGLLSFLLLGYLSIAVEKGILLQHRTVVKND